MFSKTFQRVTLAGPSAGDTARSQRPGKGRPAVTRPTSETGAPLMLTEGPRVALG